MKLARTNIYKQQRATGGRGSEPRVGRATGGRGSELSAAESYQQRWAGWPAEASGSEPLVHEFVHRATSEDINGRGLWGNQTLEI